MAKMSVREFVRKAQLEQKQRYRNQSAAEVLLGAVSKRVEDIGAELSNAGYFSRKISQVDPESRQQAGQWCLNQFGINHFIVTDNETFWFDSEQNANWFALRW